MNPSWKEEAVYMPRTERHYHVVIDEKMHRALKLYASGQGITLASATARLIRRGLIYELSGLKDAENRASVRKLVSEIIKKGIKGGQVDV